MHTATAHAYTEIRYAQPANVFAFGEVFDVEDSTEMEAAEILPSDLPLDSLNGPILVAADWMPVAIQQILDSVPGMFVPENDGAWLDAQIASNALAFLEATSDVLPTFDPYLYTSLDGDLVVEFSAPRGKLTSVIGKTAGSIFARIDGYIFKSAFNLPFENVITVRKELQRMTHQLRDGAHGIVEA